MVRIWLTLCMAAMLLWPAAADARRVALVIGNASYSETSSLANSANDAEMVAGAARRAGFDDVVLARDLDMAAFQNSLRDFRQKATGADVAMVYYAGHGIEGRGKNWLIPVDAKLGTSFDLPYESVNLDRVMEAIEGARIRMVVLDACRNNPFGKDWRSGSRAVQGGLVAVDVDDVLVIYAAAPGQTAADGSGASSPFAASFAKRVVQPGLPIQLLGGSVRDDVLAATGGNQRPYVSASITGTPVYLVEKPIAPPPAAAPKAVSTSPALSTGNRARLDALSWRGALSANSTASYSAYITEFPDGLFADLAKERINGLRQPVMSGRVTAVQPAPVSTPPSTPAAASPAVNPPVERSPAPQLALQDSAPPSTPPSTPLATTPPAGTEATDDAAPALGTADRAYVPPASAEPPLPELPPTPVLLQKDYPDCREDHLSLDSPNDKAIDINRCTVLLDQYYDGVLNGYRKTMVAHQNEITRIFEDEVAGQMKYSAATRDRFFAEVMEEHGDSNPDGANLATYRAAVQLYEADRGYLRDRFCYNTGCGGYTVPEYDYGKKKKSTDSQGRPVKTAKKSKGKKCKKSRGRGRLLGGIFGGLAGNAAGLGKIGSLIASGVGAVLVGEIACQLDEKEQEEAAEATIAVTEKEEVGAVAEWKSPTRAGVSGSSTITAVNTQPNGNRCLNITDVAIIDGQETRVSKRMCRGQGDEGYVIMA